jgi:hypothetical protein
MHTVIELRKSKRYRLSASAIFEWASHVGLPQSAQGVTRDLNASGVYVQADAVPPPGALVQLDISLPSLAEAGSGMHLYGEGVVLRSEPNGANDAGAAESGFAASVQFYPEETASVLSRLETSN